MAFPTSPSNNQVHKEGNRAFVYDSALGVWDQVKETDRTENKLLQGEIATGVTFPAGKIIQTTTVTHGSTTTNCNVGNNTWTDTVVSGSITCSSATNAVIVHFDYAVYLNNTTSNAGAGFRIKKVHSGGTSYPDTLSQYDGSGTIGLSCMFQNDTGDHLNRMSSSQIDPSAGIANSQITYTVQCSEYGTEALSVGNATMESRWMIWFQEVQK